MVLKSLISLQCEGICKKDIKIDQGEKIKLLSCRRMFTEKNLEHTLNIRA